MHSYYFQRLGLCKPATDAPGPVSGGAKKPKTQKAKTQEEEEEEELETEEEEEEEELETEEEEEEEEEGKMKGKAKKPAAKGGTIQRAISMFRGKGALGAEISSLRSQVTKLTAEKKNLATELATVKTERDGLQAQFDELETALEKAEGEKTTLQKEVTHQLASTGLPESNLPKAAPKPGASGGSLDDQIAALHQQAEQSTDPREKGKLANQIWDLELKKAKGDK